MAALKEIGAVGACVPETFGGLGVSLEAIARACFELSRRCAATGMIFAMHHIQLLTIVRHLDGAPWFEGYLRDVVAGQRVIASATSEVGTGGDLSRSIAPVVPDGDGWLRFDKHAPTLSYGAQAEDVLSTVRRDEDADESDQVLVLSREGDTELEPAGEWDTLGMRGTCSPGFVVHARFRPEQILAAPFASMLNESIVPLTHILWAFVWLGIATDAFERGQAFVRHAARRNPGTPVPAAHRLSQVLGELTVLRAEADAALREFERIDGDREQFSTVGTILRINNIKIAASEQTLRVCLGVLDVVGIAGYRNNSPYAVGRQLRDALSTRLMIANDRIHSVNAGLLLVAKEA
jgi:acyl-CoA dehydrogenase